MLWQLFYSECSVQEALERSTDYDISPQVLTFPANANEEPAPEPATGKPKLTLWTNYTYKKEDQAADDEFWGQTLYSK